MLILKTAAVPVASIVAAFVFVLGLLVGPAAAGPNRRPELYRYTTSFTCGGGQNLGNAVDGQYATAVNLFNADLSDATIRASLALIRLPADPETAAGDASVPLDLVIEGGRALQIACDDILEDFVFEPPVESDDRSQGFLVIDSDLPLDADVVYTASSGPDGEASIDVERLEARRVPAPRPDDDEPSTVTICHVPPGNPGNAHTIQVGRSAVSAHRAHGDTVGACAD